MKKVDYYKKILLYINFFIIYKNGSDNLLSKKTEKQY